MVDDGRTDDGRTPDHGHPISSPCEPYGSGELKKILVVQFSFFYSSSSIIQFQEISVIKLPQENTFGFKLLMTTLWCNVLVIM